MLAMALAQTAQLIVRAANRSQTRGLQQMLRLAMLAQLPRTQLKSSA